MLETMYFKDKHDGIQQVNEKWKHYFVTHKPLDDHVDQNSWRNGAYQLFLVLLAYGLGIYSYLAIGRKVETDAAVQEGIEVLKDVIYFQWVAFALYNVIVLVYYQKSIIHNIKSWSNSIRSFLLCLWCRAPDNDDLEATFKPTW